MNCTEKRKKTASCDPCDLVNRSSVTEGQIKKNNVKHFTDHTGWLI